MLSGEQSKFMQNSAWPLQAAAPRGHNKPAPQTYLVMSPKQQSSMSLPSVWWISLTILSFLRSRVFLDFLINPLEPSLHSQISTVYRRWTKRFVTRRVPRMGSWFPGPPPPPPFTQNAGFCFIFGIFYRGRPRTPAPPLKGTAHMPGHSLETLWISTIDIPGKKPKSSAF